MDQDQKNGNDIVAWRELPDALVVSFTEKRIYDVSAVEMVEFRIRSLLEGEPANMVINFAGVDFMVTRVINILLVALKRIRAHGGEVYLAGMNRNIRRVFNIMRLNAVFSIFDTEQQALDALAGPEKPS